jgi:hypothetical protein
MEMHCVSRQEVVALIQDRGGHVIDIEEERMPGGLQSYRYWVRKPDANDGDSRQRGLGDR